MLPKTYRDFINSLEASMRKARDLGLFRTAKRIHRALEEARSEAVEAAPELPTVTTVISTGEQK